MIIGSRVVRHGALFELSTPYGDWEAVHAMEREAAVLYVSHVVILEEHNAVRVLDHRTVSMKCKRIRSEQLEFGAERRHGS